MQSQGPPKLAQLVVEVSYTTAKAYKVATSQKSEVWLPKSQCSITPLSSSLKRNYDAYLTLPEWLAVKSGLMEKRNL